ncbi:MAG: phosphatidylglycerol lysyltransferase domain-containing protein [Dysgonamonadaceae bacterium]|jgi:hypothetical protein|nr:phosphatidylglycerol lysyltransferase domain-containing protein [Dysgonamonadaceae bacterium]
MIEFRNIELQDKEIIDKYLINNPYRASESCFSNLYGWAHKYKTQYAVWRDYLLVKFTSDRGGCSYLTPFGKGNLASAIEILVEECGCPIKFEMSGVTQAMREEIESAMPRRFEFKRERSVYDYIYRAEKLINLSGKKLQSKRNHINRFTAQNKWRYISITKNPWEVDSCKDMLQKWYDINKESSDESLELDFKSTSLFLDNFEALNLRGGAIEVDDEIVAFSLGAQLNEDTFIVHVEKAFADIQGAYAIINQQFVLNEASEFTYINREEDMGYPSLRKSKMSYRPDILLEKFIVKEKVRK